MHTVLVVLAFFVLLVSGSPLAAQETQAETVEVWIEAEAPVSPVKKPLVIANDNDASGAKFLRLSKKKPGGQAVYEFEVDSAGDYVIWGRVLSLRKNADTFRISLNDQEPITWELGVNPYWTWISVNDNKAIRTFPLEAGRHTLTLYGQERDARLDKLYITNNTTPLPPSIREVVPVGKAFSGQFLRFDLLTLGNKQYVAYYAENQQMTIASRSLSSSTFEIKKLDSFVGWNSHDYVTMGIDSEGHLHVSGNMSDRALVYFRTSTAGDISTLQPASMVSPNRERRITYPRFFVTPGGVLVFSFRSKSKTSPGWYFNRYDPKTKTWAPLMTEPLFLFRATEPFTRVYFSGERLGIPILGPDNWYHVSFHWRDIGGAQYNHTLSYAKSPDLKSWFWADGTPISLPITPENTVPVDPIPVFGGLRGSRIGFDGCGQPLITYHKYDEPVPNTCANPPCWQGVESNIYNARFQDGQWVIHLMKEWDQPYKFWGKGVIGGNPMRVQPPMRQRDGTLTQLMRLRGGGGANYIVQDTSRTCDAGFVNTGKPYRGKGLQAELPASLTHIETRCDACKAAGERLGVRYVWSDSMGAPAVPDSSLEYVLRWEVLPPNRDRKRSYVSPPSELRLYAFDRDYKGG